MPVCQDTTPIKASDILPQLPKGSKKSVDLCQAAPPPVSAYPYQEVTKDNLTARYVKDFKKSCPKDPFNVTNVKDAYEAFGGGCVCMQEPNKKA
jgi:hypothetical protein